MNQAPWFRRWSFANVILEKDAKKTGKSIINQIRDQWPAGLLIADAVVAEGDVCSISRPELPDLANHQTSARATLEPPGNTGRSNVSSHQLTSNSSSRSSFGAGSYGNHIVPADPLCLLGVHLPVNVEKLPTKSILQDNRIQTLLKFETVSIKVFVADLLGITPDRTSCRRGLVGVARTIGDCTIRPAPFGKSRFDNGAYRFACLMVPQGFQFLGSFHKTAQTLFQLIADKPGYLALNRVVISENILSAPLVNNPPIPALPQGYV